MPGGKNNIRPEDGTQGFDVHPENAGRPKGSKNRSTILKKWIEVVAKVKHPETHIEELGTMEDKVALALLSKALKGDIAAIKEIYDTMYGKIVDKSEVKTEGEIIIQLEKFKPDGTEV